MSPLPKLDLPSLARVALPSLPKLEFKPLPKPEISAVDLAMIRRNQVTQRRLKRWRRLKCRTKVNGQWVELRLTIVGLKDLDVMYGIAARVFERIDNAKKGFQLCSTERH